MAANELWSTEGAARERHTLAHFALFKSLSGEEIRRIERLCVWRRFERGGQILRRDDRSTEVYFVASGLVRVWLPTWRRTDVIIADVGAGELFGELAAIDGQPRLANVTALTATTVACMPAIVFRSAISQHEDVAAQVLLLMAAHVRERNARVWELSALSVRERVRAELLRLGRSRTDQPNHAIISPPPTHTELAARISGHREAVTRELRALEREGLLTRRRGALVLCDVAALAGWLEKVHTTRGEGHASGHS